jgi:hypothetical protein
LFSSSTATGVGTVCGRTPGRMRGTRHRPAQGRSEAIAIAPSLPPAAGAKPGGALAADAGTGHAADTVAALAAVLRDRLTDAAAPAGAPDDQVACQDAADAAGRICQLMTR